MGGPGRSAHGNRGQLEFETNCETSGECRLVTLREDVATRLQVVQIRGSGSRFGPGIDGDQPGLVTDVEEIRDHLEAARFSELVSVVAMEIQGESNGRCPETAAGRDRNFAGISISRMSGERGEGDTALDDPGSTKVEALPLVVGIQFELVSTIVGQDPRGLLVPQLAIGIGEIEERADVGIALVVVVAV